MPCINLIQGIFYGRAFLLANAVPALADLPAAPAYIDDSAYPPAARQRILPAMFEQTLTSTRYIAKADNPLITVAEADSSAIRANHSGKLSAISKISS